LVVRQEEGENFLRNGFRAVRAGIRRPSGGKKRHLGLKENEGGGRRGPPRGIACRSHDERNLFWKESISWDASAPELVQGEMVERGVKKKQEEKNLAVIAPPKTT